MFEGLPKSMWFRLNMLQNYRCFTFLERNYVKGLSMKREGSIEKTASEMHVASLGLDDFRFSIKRFPYSV